MGAHEHLRGWENGLRSRSTPSNWRGFFLLQSSCVQEAWKLLWFSPLSVFLTLQLGILGLQVSAMECQAWCGLQTPVLKPNTWLTQQSPLPPVFLISKVTNKNELGNLLCSWAWAGILNSLCQSVMKACWEGCFYLIPRSAEQPRTTRPVFQTKHDLVQNVSRAEPENHFPI